MHRTEIGAARHTDLAIAPVLLADPLLRVVAVVGFAEGVEVAFGVPAAAAVLQNAGVAIVGEAAGVLDYGVDVIAVGGTDEDCGEGALCAGQVDISGKLYVVAHGDFYI